MNHTFWNRVKDESDAVESSKSRGRADYGVDSMYKRRRIGSDVVEDPVPAPIHSPRSIPQVNRRSPMTKISSLMNSPDHPLPPKHHVSPPPAGIPLPTGHASQPALGRVVLPSPGIPAESDRNTNPLPRPPSQENRPSRRVDTEIRSDGNRTDSLSHATWSTMLSVKPSMDRSPAVYRFPHVAPVPSSTRISTPDLARKASPVYTSPEPPKRHLPSDGLPEPPLYFAEQERLDKSPEPSRSPATSNSLPMRRKSLAPPAQAWFAIGRTDLVNMGQWDQAARRAYERGYEDALAALQRGFVGIDGEEYSCPVLVNREPEPYKYVNGRRLSAETSSFHQLYSGLTRGESRRPSIDDSYLRYTQPLSSSWSEGLPRDSTVPPPLRRNSKIDPGYMYSGHDPYDFHSNAPAPTTTSPPNGTTRNIGQRQLISCYPCRSRKMKCDGQKPCGQCAKRGGEGDCEYAAEVKRRGRGKKSRGSEAGRSGTEDSSQESLIPG